MLPPGLTLYPIRPREEDIPLLKTFYHDLILATFGDDMDLMDSFETWVESLMDPSPGYVFHADLVLDEKGKIAGGLMYEFYPRSLCGLLSYVVVIEEYRGKGIANYLIQEGKRFLNEDAKAYTKNPDAEIRGIFLETHFPPLSHVPHDKSLFPSSPPHDHESLDVWAKRMVLFNRLGFSLLEIPYLQPPLGPDKDPSFDLILLASLPPDRTEISAAIVSEWLVEFNEFVDNEGKVSVHYQRLIAMTQQLAHVSVLNVPTFLDIICEKKEVRPWMRDLIAWKAEYFPHDH
jgi:hypothetical protein